MSHWREKHLFVMDWTPFIWNMRRDIQFWLKSRYMSGKTRIPRARYPQSNIIFLLKKTHKPETILFILCLTPSNDDALLKYNTNTYKLRDYHIKGWNISNRSSIFSLLYKIRVILTYFTHIRLQFKQNANI